MAWIELHDTLPDHPKVLRLAKALRIDKDAAVGKLVRLWTWALSHREDGRFTRLDWETIAEVFRFEGKPQTLIRALVQARLLDGEEGLLKIHNWDERVCMLMEKREKMRSQGRERAQRFRDRQKVGSDGSPPCDSADPAPARPGSAGIPPASDPPGPVTRCAAHARNGPNAATVPNRTPDEDDEDEDDIYARARARAEVNTATAYEAAFGRPPNRAELRDIATTAANLHLEDVIHRAVTMAALKGAKSVTAYVRAIARDWRFNRITDEDQLDEYLYLSDCANERILECGSIGPAEARKRICELREARTG